LHYPLYNGAAHVGLHDTEELWKKNFSFLLFSLSSISEDMLALQNGPQSFNCIGFDLFVLKFISWHLIFYIFFYQI
jgi:hypothetical protein